MISIIIPVYNAEKYINECVASVINQNYSDFECILVDDGSTDGSAELCYKWAKRDKRIKIIHQNNSGVSIARNKGIEHATGEYIVFIDSDDYVNISYLSDMICETNDNIDLVISGYRPFPQIKDNNITFLYQSNIIELTEKHIHHFVEINKKSLLYGPCAKLYKSSIIKNNHIIFDPNLSLGEDLHFNYAYLKYCKFLYTVSKANYNYRVNISNSLSKKIRENLFEICYKEWNTLKDFYISKKMWNTTSQEYLYSLLWGFIYDSIFQYTLLPQKNIKYISNILKTPEIKNLKSFYNIYPCKNWIKNAIIYKQSWIFYLYFKLIK